MTAIFTALIALAISPLLAQNLPSLNPDMILGHLNQVITWYRDATSKVQPPGLPSDALYQDNAQGLAAEVVQLAFQSARAEAAALRAMDKNSSNSAQPVEAALQQQDFTQMAARLSSQIDDLKTKLDTLNKRLQSAPPSRRKTLLAQRDALQGELTLNQSILDAVQKMANFVEGASETSGSLEGKIEQLARSIPEVEGKSAGLKPNPKPQPAPTGLAASSGLIGQALSLLSAMQSVHQIDLLLDETSRLRQTVDAVRKPLRDILVATMQRGRDLASQAEAAASAPPPGARQKPGAAKQPSAAAPPPNTAQEFRNLEETFKLLSAATLPLSQELLVIDQTRANFLEWRKSIIRESSYALRSLIVRVIGIALALAVVLVLSEIWRRLTFRYIHEARRRRQFLLMRRFVVGFLIGVVLIMGFVSEFSSLATFAGFVTAGIAVGLQAVLLSVAAYFFVIGRYGIRVGDRISVAGVTGDVIDVGLVRMYLLELAGTSVDLQPTGRIIVISNSVLFQAATPLFKQVPGTEYSWHEIAAPLSPTANYKLVQEKLFGAVNSVYQQYRADLENDLGSIERHLEVQLKAPVPEGKLQFADAGLEYLVRYPVEIRRAAEIDDHVTRVLLDLIQSDPELKAAVTGSPKIRAPIKG